MDTSVIILAIQAGVRLGRKLNDVLVDKTRERALILPLGNLMAMWLKTTRSITSGNIPN
jgi:hypothetical protein